MKYLPTRGTYTMVPGASSARDVANVMGSAYVPIPPAVGWIVGNAMAPPGGVLSHQP